VVRCCLRRERYDTSAEPSGCRILTFGFGLFFIFIALGLVVVFFVVTGVLFLVFDVFLIRLEPIDRSRLVGSSITGNEPLCAVLGNRETN